MLPMKHNFVVDLSLVDIKLVLCIAVVPAIFGYTKVLDISDLIPLCYGKIWCIRLMRAQNIVRIGFFVFIFYIIHIQEVCNNNFL